ncbi:MAG TPA: hypothetical protein VIV06_09095 [Candidatus Limnocylindrales bacterium]
MDPRQWLSNLRRQLESLSERRAVRRRLATYVARGPYGSDPIARRLLSI